MNRYWIVAALAGILVLSKANSEYNSLKANVAEAKSQSMGVVDDVRKLLDSISKTVADLREKLLLLEDANRRLESANSELKLSIQRHEMQLKQAAQRHEVEARRAQQDSLPEPKVDKPLAKVVMHSNINCEPCKIWKRNYMPSWRAQGWVVEIVEETDTSKGWPWFEICEGDVCYEVRGLLSSESYLKAKGALKR